MKGLFLDRDGVINVDNNYVHKVSDFIFNDYIFDLCRAAIHKHYKIIVITNQAGIGRGLYSESDFLDLTRWMIDVFISQEVAIERVYFCPFHKEHGIGQYKRDSFDRKPNPGMLLRAKKKFNLDMNESILIGDKISDIKAGNNALVKTNILFNKKKKNYKKNNLNKFIEINSLTDALKYL